MSTAFLGGIRSHRTPAGSALPVALVALAALVAAPHGRPRALPGFAR